MNDIKSRIDRIKEALTDRFKPTSLEIIDDTDRHKGHPGVQGKKNSHLTVVIQADEFNDVNSVERHRMVYNAIGREFRVGLHAVSIKFIDPKD